MHATSAGQRPRPCLRARLHWDQGGLLARVFARRPVRELGAEEGCPRHPERYEPQYGTLCDVVLERLCLSVHTTALQLAVRSDRELEPDLLFVIAPASHPSHLHHFHPRHSLTSLCDVLTQQARAAVTDSSGPAFSPPGVKSEAVHIIDPNSYKACTEALEGMYGPHEPAMLPKVRQFAS